MKTLVLVFIFLFALTTDGLGAGYQPVDDLTGGPIHSRKRSSGSATKAPVSPAKAPASARASRSPRQYTGKDGSPLLFGTVEIGMALKSLPQWLTVISKNSAEPIFQPEKYFNKSTTWAQLRDRTSGKSSLQQLQVINEFWNKWKYIDDRANWGTADYWAYPAQFLKKSGDCEDYAIVKYFTLKELGFDPHLMRIVVLKNTFTGEGHAVLAVYMNNDVYILDNLSPVVLSHKRIGQYEPQYSVNEFQRWQHIPPKSN